MHHLVFVINFLLHSISLILVILLHILLISPILNVTTFTVHYSYSFSLQTQYPHFLQILPTIDVFRPIGLPSRTLDC